MIIKHVRQVRQARRECHFQVSSPLLRQKADLLLSKKRSLWRNRICFAYLKSLKWWRWDLKILELFCLSVCLSVCLSLCLSLSLCISVCVYLCNSVVPSLWQSVSLSLCFSVVLSLSVSLSLCLSVSLSLRHSVSLSLCFSVVLSFCPYVSLLFCRSVSLSLCLSVSLCLFLSFILSLSVSVSLSFSFFSVNKNLRSALNVSLLWAVVRDLQSLGCQKWTTSSLLQTNNFKSLFLTCLARLTCLACLTRRSRLTLNRLSYMPCSSYLSGLSCMQTNNIK